MIVAFDTYYYDNSAKTVGVSFQNWEDAEALDIKFECLEGIQPYEPGSFYKRELPCILSLLKQYDLEEIRCIVVDGYCILNNENKYGLGGYLFEALGSRIPIIGVAKTRFKANTENVKELIRGESIKPLYISSIGISVEDAYGLIQCMDGEYRMPTLLKLLDMKTREGVRT